MHDVAVRSRAKTWISMCRGDEHVFLDEHARIAEGARGLALRARERGLEIAGLVDPPHALAAAARDRLDQHRIADLVGLAGAGSRAPGGRRDSPAPPARRPSRTSALAASFRPIARIAAAGGPTKTMPFAAQASRELGPLGEEAVARMDRTRRRRGFATVDDLVDDEIALARRRRPDEMRLVRHLARRARPASASE